MKTQTISKNGRESIILPQREVTIEAPRFETALFKLIGISPYVQNRFSAKAMNQMIKKMELGSIGKKGQKREARNFEENYRNAMHKSKEGWYGVPAGAFRNAMISACRIVGFQMTKAKLSVFVEADGLDEIDFMPLVRIIGDPKPHTMYARNATGVCDIRVRPMWEKWSIDLRVRFDADMFTSADIGNLLLRAGQQVGIGEGRPDSKESAGLGWGMFTIGGKD